MENFKPLSSECRIENSSLSIDYKNVNRYIKRRHLCTLIYKTQRESIDMVSLLCKLIFSQVNINQTMLTH